jgi:hypothetical protein
MLLFLTPVFTIYMGAQPFPPVAPVNTTFEVPDVKNADVSLDIKSPKGSPLYRLQCHSAGYTGDAGFDYSGDFECRLSSIGQIERYSTLLTEDHHQSRDWESRARFFADNLRGTCASIPDFGATRNFQLRGMSLTLQIIDPLFAADGSLNGLKLKVTVRPDPGARRPIARVVPLPKGSPADCKLKENFVDPASFSVKADKGK